MKNGDNFTKRLSIVAITTAIALTSTSLTVFASQEVNTQPVQKIETKAEETKQVEEPQWLKFNNVTINIGDPQETVESKIGKADRKGASQFNFEWNIYNSDPTMLTMIGYIDNKVAGIYHMSKVFTSSNGNYGDKPTGNAIIGIFGASMIFKDQLNDGITYAVLLLADNEGYIETNELKESNTYFNDFAKNQLDVANVFRNWNDVQPLIWDDSLASVAQAHSQDMADRNYFNHTTPDGITVSDRIKASTKYQNGWGENISQRTFNLGLDGFMFIDQWINSQGHRENLLRTSFNYFGSGCASKLNSIEVYSTQNFASLSKIEPTTKAETPEKEEEPQWVKFNNVTINIGDAQEAIESKIGKADRKGASQFNFEWNIYNSDPTMLTMIGYIDNKVAGIYHMSKVFTSSYGNYGDTHKWQSPGMIMLNKRLKFVDILDNNKVYGVMLVSNYVEQDSDEDAPTNFNDFSKNQLEVVNVFRNWNNVQPLIWDDSLASTASAHSQDMANRNFYSSTTPDGIKFYNRIKTNTKFQNGGENISKECRTGSLYEGFMKVNWWMGITQFTRDNILQPSFNYFGAGYAADEDPYEIYSTQDFAK